MATPNETLPEGTDSIIEDADVVFTPDPMIETPTADAAAPAETPSKAAQAFKAVDEKTQGIRQQAFGAAKDYAAQGKDRTVGALDGVVKFVDDAAATLDEKVGAQYGDYARKASETISGVAATLRDKDVDALFEEAQNLIRKSPAIAIGAAAAAGFVLARLIKAGATAAEQTAESLKTGTDKAA